MQKIDFFDNVDKFINRYVKVIDKNIDDTQDTNQKNKIFSNAQSIYSSYYTLQNILVTYFQDIYEQSNSFSDNFFEALSYMFAGDFDVAKNHLQYKTKDQEAKGYIIPIIQSILEFDFDTANVLFEKSIKTKSIYINNLFYAIFLDDIDDIELSREYYLLALKKAKSEYEVLRVLYFLTYQDYQMTKISQDVLNVLESIADFDHDLKGLIYQNIALCYYESRYFAESEEYVHKAINIFSKDGLSEYLASVLLLKGDLKIVSKEYEVALQIYEQVQSMIDKKSQLYPKTLNGIAKIYHNQHKTKQALQLHQEALTNIDFTKDSFELYNTHFLIANIFEEINANIEAISAYKLALEYIKNLGDRNIYLEAQANSLKHLANLYKKVNDFKNAKEAFLDLYEIEKKLFLHHQSDYAMVLIDTLEDLAEVFYLAGDYGKSLEVNQTLFESFKFLALHDDHFKENMADSLNAIAVIISKNKPFEAIEKFNEALRLINKEFVQYPLKYGAKVAIIMINIGLIYKKLNQTDIAKTMLIEAIEILENLVDNNVLFEDMIFINALNNIAHIFIETKELNEAKTYYDKMIHYLQEGERSMYLLARAYLESGALVLDMLDIEEGLHRIRQAYHLYQNIETPEATKDIEKCLQILSKYDESV